MNVCINGETVDFPDGMTVADLLEQRGLAGKRLAIERNGEIVPKGAHAKTLLQPLDRIEIVIAVGGG